MEYTINSETKTITIFSEGGNVEEIKSIMETFKGYTLLTGTKKEKRKGNRPDYRPN